MAVNILDQSLMHQDNLRLAADLGMYRHGKYKSVVLAVQEVELLPPQPLNHVRVHVPTGADATKWLHRWPVIKVPVGGDFNHTAGFEGAHGGHPFGGLRLALVGLSLFPGV